MTIIISSLVMLAFFGVIVITEQRCARRSKEFFKKSDEMIADLASRVEQRYKDKFGKDPTGKIAVIAEKSSRPRPA